MHACILKDKDWPLIVSLMRASYVVVKRVHNSLVAVVESVRPTDFGSTAHDHPVRTCVLNDGGG